MACYTGAMFRTWLFGFLFGLILIGQAILFFAIPSLGAAVFLSPDETATAVAARSFADQAKMSMEDPLLADAPWLHPRSFVAQGTAIVPVGFLGLPILLGLVWKVIGDMGLVLFVPLLVLSTAFPLWRLASRFRFAGQMATVITWLSFPAVLYYGNRGLFPNLPVVCFAVWAVYLIWEKRTVVRGMLAGACAGFALMIRPVEAVWILAWLALAWRLRQEPGSKHERRIMLLGFAVTLLVLAGAVVVAWRTYGSPWAIGYFLRDPVFATDGTVVAAPSAASMWPFGMHPRNVWFNVRSYIFGLLAPWALVALGALSVTLKERKNWPIILSAVWTFAVLAALYGEAIYQDHVGVNVISTGNSFLRYLLPLAVLFALSAGLLVKWCERFRVGGRSLAILVVGLLALLGTWTAFARDDEGIVTSSRELVRYFQIRRSTIDTIGRSAIILAERSDKIFFPTFRAASPLPPRDVIFTLASASPVPVFLYAQTFDEQRLAEWNRSGLTLRPVLQSRQETLYEMVAIATSTTP